MANHTDAEASPPRRRRSGCLRRILIGLGIVVAVLVIAVAALLVTKPWAPDVEVADPGPSGRRVTDGGMIANYYPAPGGRRAPAVLIVGGSEGGLNRGVDREARALQDKGFTALALSYWGAPGQPSAMENLPLETFTGALDWLARQPDVDPAKLGFMGTSKGGEAAVLLASRTPTLKAVVGYVPSNVVWAGINLREPWKQLSIGSTWSAGGTPLPYLPYDGSDYRGGPLVQLYAASLTKVAEHEDAVIPVESSTAPLLLVCGEQDQMWPSCPMARDVAKRAAAKGGPPVTVLAYPDAGHLLTGPPLATPGSVDLAALGGTQPGAEAALADSWPKVLAFLTKELG